MKQVQRYGLDNCGADRHVIDAIIGLRVSALFRLLLHAPVRNSLHRAHSSVKNPMETVAATSCFFRDEVDTRLVHKQSW